MKKRVSLLVCFTLLLTLLASGCASQFDMGQAKEFSVDGLSITLDDSFSQLSASEDVRVFDSKKMTVYVTSETFDHLEATGYAEIPTLKEYVGIVMHANGVGENAVIEDGIRGFSFTSISDNKSFTHRVYLYEGEDRYWTVRFVVFSDDYEEACDVITKYALSVNVK